MRYYPQLFILLLSLLFGDVYGQELPPIQNFTPKTYDADNQNWAISQSSNKFIYFAASE